MTTTTPAEVQRRLDEDYQPGTTQTTTYNGITYIRFNPAMKGYHCTTVALTRQAVAEIVAKLQQVLMQ